MKFNLKLFVLVGVLAGFRDVCGTEDEGEHKDYGDFIVAGLADKEKNALTAAIDERRVIKAVYQAKLFSPGFIMHGNFENQLYNIVVWDGHEGKTVKINTVATFGEPKIVYRKQQNEKYTVYFIFKKGNVDSTKEMFRSCRDLISADFTFFNPKSVTNMSGMFSNCSALKELNLSNFKTQSVTDMSYMFYFCTSLKELYLVDFDFSNVGNMENMFLGCNFDKLYLSKKYKDIRNRYCCCGDEYVYINAKKVVEFNPKKVTFVEVVQDDPVSNNTHNLV